MHNVSIFLLSFVRLDYKNSIDVICLKNCERMHALFVFWQWIYTTAVQAVCGGNDGSPCFNEISTSSRAIRALVRPDLVVMDASIFLRYCMLK
jgi:hypothetical protein